MIERIVVAGLAGGVGTTTLTALTHAVMTAQGLAVGLGDHVGGTLARRIDPQPRFVFELPPIAYVRFAGAQHAATGLTLVDAGLLTGQVAAQVTRLTALVLVAPPDDRAAGLAQQARDQLAARLGTQVLPRVLVAQVVGRRDALPVGDQGIHGLARLPVLAEPGALSVARLGPGAGQSLVVGWTQAVSELVHEGHATRG